jgi:hypothetical protein
MNKKRIASVALILMLLLSLLAGCSTNSGNVAAPDRFDTPEIGDKLVGNDVTNGDVLTDRKLIRKVNITAETEDMDVFLADVTDRVTALGGYIESRNVQNGSAYSSYRSRYATLVIRIPAAQVDAFLQKVDETSNVVSTVEDSDDVTLQYAATESRLKVLRTEEERLVEFLSEAKTVSEMLEIEKRLTQVQSEIETITTQLNKYDNMVDYGTVTLSVTEVEVYTPVEEENPTTWEKISDQFMACLNGLGQVGEGLLVFFLGNSPVLFIFVVLPVGILVFFLGRGRRRKKDAAPKQ